MRPRFSSLLAKLTGIPIIIVVLGAAFSAFISLHLLQTSAEESVSAAQRSEVAALKRDVAAKLDKSLLGLMILIKALDKGKLHDAKYLQNYLDARHFIPLQYTAGIAAIDVNGTVLADFPRVPNRTGTDLADRVYFQEVVATRQAVVGRAIVDKTTGLQVVQLSVPVTDKRGALALVMTGYLLASDPSFLGSFADQTREDGNETSIISLRDDLFVASTVSGRAFLPLPTPGLSEPGDVIRQGARATFKASNSEKIEKLYSIEPLDSVGWMLLQAKPVSLIYGPLQPIKWYLVAGALTTAILSAVAIFVLSRRGMRHLKRVQQSVSSMSSGQTEVRLLDVRGEREVQELTSAFNYFIAASLRGKQELEALVMERTKQAMDLYNQAPCGYHSLDAEGNVLQINDTELQWLGYHRDEVVGVLDIFSILTPTSAATFRQNFSNFKVTGELKDFELEFVRKNGSVLPVLLNAKAEYTHSGEFRRSLSTMVDYSAKKAFELEIERREKILETVINAYPGMVAYWDANLFCQYANHAYLDWFGRSSEAMRGISMQALLGPELFQRNKSQIEKALAGEFVTFERELTKADGTIGYTLTHYAPVVRAAQTFGFVALVTDVTMIKLGEQALVRAKEAAEEANRMKSDFLSNISHEIRTPMNAIMGLSYLLSKSNLSASDQDTIKKIRGSGRLLLGIINDVLDHSKIEAGKLDIESAEFSLTEVLTNVAALMSSLAADKELELVITPINNDIDVLVGDALRIEQVLVNLVSNAVKFTPAGYVHLALQSRVLPEGRSQITFTIEDSGIGMSAAQQEQLFQPFKQVDVATTRRFGGTGLGLSISRKLVALMGGSIGVNSVEGRGSTFWFTLDLVAATQQHLSTPELHGLHVMVVDDNGMAREALALTVNRLGWRPVPVSSGEDALKRVSMPSEDTLKTDVILMDWKMPGMDGLQASKIIKRLTSGATEPIILMVTAYSRELLLNHPDADVVDDVLVKPVTTSSLYNAICKALQVRRGGAPAQPVDRASHRLDGIRLMVVDDSEINCEVARRIFEGEGAKLHIHADGESAVQWLQNNPTSVDLVLMDLQMPVMDGFMATELIHRCTGLETLPVIALTAGAFTAQRDKAMACGMVDYIAKPFDVDKAIATILNHVSQPMPSSPKTAPPERPWATDLSPTTLTQTDLLPLLDTAQGLSIWKDAQVYTEYLQKFSATNADLGPALASLEHSALHSAAHKLKGAAANLGLKRLAAVAGFFEQGPEAGQDDPRLRSQLKRVIALTTVAIQAWVSGSRPVDVQTRELGDMPVDLARVTGPLRSLYRAWPDNDPHTIEQHLCALADLLPTARLSPIWAHLRDFDFQAGERTTQKLAQSLGIELTGGE